MSNGLVSSSFRDRDPGGFFEKTLRSNHPNAYKRREEEKQRQYQLYDKYCNHRPARVLNGRELQEALEICSESPSQCFSFQETLRELGFNNLHSSQDRLNSLQRAVGSGYAILALRRGGGWGGHTASNNTTESIGSYIAKTAAETGFALAEGVAGEVYNAGVGSICRYERCARSFNFY